MGAMRMFYFGDTDAPRLSGTAGDAAGVLDALLVNGYNSKTLTSITRSGSTATATLTSHGFSANRLVRIAGCDQAEYNGDFWVTSVTSSTFTFEVSGTPATPATTGSSITAKVAPCDWTIAYTGTNIRSYLQGAGSNGFVMGLDDTGTTTCRIRGFESMTAAGVAVTDGSGPFPTDAQTSGGRYWRKSDSENTNSRYWIAFGDEKSFFILSYRYNTSGPPDCGFWFGDLKAYKGDDLYATVLRADSDGATNWSDMPPISCYPLTASLGSSEYQKGYAARSSSGAGGSVHVQNVSLCVNPGSSSTNLSTMSENSSQITYPAPISGGLIMAPLAYVEQLESGVRGEIRGAYVCAHSQPLTTGDTFSGAVGTPLAGKKFYYMNLQSSGALITQIDGDWDG